MSFTALTCRQALANARLVYRLRLSIPLESYKRQTALKLRFNAGRFVDSRGIEPLTSSMPWKRSTK